MIEWIWGKRVEEEEENDDRIYDESLLNQTQWMMWWWLTNKIQCFLFVFKIKKWNEKTETIANLCFSFWK